MLSPNTPGLVAANRQFHRWLVEGVPVEYQRDGQTRGDRVRLIDFSDVGRNDWLAVNQFTVQGPKHTRRPDLVLPSALEFSIGHNGSSKAEVNQVMEQAKNAWAFIVKPAKDTFWGGYAGYFQDPDGHLWEIAWNPQWPIPE